MKYLTCKNVALLTLSTIGSGAIAELKDPYSRDDDISHAVVSVDVQVRSDGQYVYEYEVHSPELNTGYVSALIIDISCDDSLSPPGFNPDTETFDPSAGLPSSFSPDGKHVPAIIEAEWGQAGITGIQADNRASWGVTLEPGQSATGLRMISPNGPGSRMYTLNSSEDYKWGEYDYDSVAWGTDATDTLPWGDDWTVTGMTTGPACPGEEYPDNGGGDDGTRFPGALFAGETDELNQLLTYSRPLQDQLHQADGARELEMVIHYHADIDPKTFVVTPQRHGISKLFHPAPGTSETVRLPLDAGKNRIELQVKRNSTPPGKSGQRPTDPAARGGVNLDKDVFVVRVPADTASPRQGKGSNK